MVNGPVHPGPRWCVLQVRAVRATKCSQHESVANVFLASTNDELRPEEFDGYASTSTQHRYVQNSDGSFSRPERPVPWPQISVFSQCFNEYYRCHRESSLEIQFEHPEEWESALGDEDEGDDDYEVVQQGGRGSTGYETDAEVDVEVEIFAVSTGPAQTNPEAKTHPMST